MKKLVVMLLCVPIIPVSAQKHKSRDKEIFSESLRRYLAFIPAKTFNMLAHTGADSVSFYKPAIRSVQSFFISKTEVTNREYREFVYYVRDSIAHQLLGHKLQGDDIDWKQSIDWNDKQLGPMFIPGEQQSTKLKFLDPQKINYTIDFYGRTETISIYPDTLVWVRDYSYASNEQLVRQYFSTTSYDQYPVVGVSLKQAIAFCIWKTAKIKPELTTHKHTSIIARLPTNAEWESAAFETKDTIVILDRHKFFYYNFGNIIDHGRMIIKGYNDDGYLYSSPVKSYRAGAYGLYDMKGNIAEWTSTPLEEVMNAEMRDGKRNAMFVVKGGSWNSTPFYLQAGVCQFLPADAAHSYTGFRYIVEVK